jgi:signal transduction histidine kinase
VRYPWLASTNGLVETLTGATWTIGDAGIVRMATADLARALARPGAALRFRQYDYRDGLNSFAQKAPGVQITVGGDGRLWALTRRNVLRIAPRREANPMPPPVAIRSIGFGTTERRDPFGEIVLPVGTTALTVAYSALSFAAPERVHFRYRLFGSGGGWIDAGSRRIVTFTDLRPGSYRYQVVAANEDGVWNSTGASLRLVIPPAFHETWGFRAVCGGLLLLGLWALYRVRLRQVSRSIRERLEARVQERERIARDLHDTLLQGVQGLIMRFQSVADQLVDTHPVRPVMEAALDRAEEMLVEGRDRVHDLRKVEQDDIEIALREIALTRSEQQDPAVISTHGLPRPVVPGVLAEIVCIVGEALFNADRHARARSITVQVNFHRQRLTVVVQDDGVGFDPMAITAGHYGLVGMRERARRIRGTLEVQSLAGRGTRIELCVPGALAYAARPGRRRRS